MAHGRGRLWGMDGGQGGGEDSIAVADWVMQHLGNLDTAEVLGEVIGRSLTYTLLEGMRSSRSTS